MSNWGIGAQDLANAKSSLIKLGSVTKLTECVKDAGGGPEMIKSVWHLLYKTINFARIKQGELAWGS